jgi:hypothetical protein
MSFVIGPVYTRRIKEIPVLPMKKLDIAALEQAYTGVSQRRS